jgi:fido (protein-threonine AMPylation protein)
VDEYSFDDGERRRLAENLLGINEQICSGDLDNASITPDLMAAIHKAFFNGVRGHAGKLRSRGFGPERIQVYERGSSLRDDVPSELDELFIATRRAIVAANTDGVAPELRVEPAIAAVAELICQLIAIQPFVDGNKRVARAMANVALRQIGIEIDLSARTEEFHEAMLVYMKSQRRDTSAMRDLLYVSIR